MTTKKREHRAAEREQQQRKDASTAGKIATAKRHQPVDVLTGTIMKRQGKNVHRQSGK